MRIAYFGSRHPRSSYSGIEHTLHAMLPLLVERGHDITVYSAPMPGEKPGRTTWNGVNIVSVPALRGKHSETLSRTAVAMTRAAMGHFDVFHFTHQGPGIFVPVAKQMGFPTVVSVEGLDWQRAKWSRGASFAIRSAERVAVRHATSIIATSGAIKSYFQTKYGRETIYLPHGLERKVTPSSSEELSKIGVEPEKFVLFAARLVREKAVHELIAAWNSVDTDMKLVIAGAGRYDPVYVESLHALAKPDKIIFVGHVQGAALAQLYGRCHLFVLPSHIEGQSLSLLEALGYGRAVLVSDIRENAELVRDNGFQFPVGNVNALQTILQELVTDPTRVQAVQAKLAEDTVNYPSWHEVARMHEDLYAAIARRGGRRARSPSGMRQGCAAAGE